ncbi:hypothetical protein [Lacrimispora brassicae]
MRGQAQSGDAPHLQGKGSFGQDSGRYRNDNGRCVYEGNGKFRILHLGLSL